MTDKKFNKKIVDIFGEKSIHVFKQILMFYV